MHLTPAILAAGYDYLMTTAPFNRWKGMPASEEISWYVGKTKRVFGECEVVKDVMDKRRKKFFRILISCDLVKTTDSLMQTLAHEMCHVRNMLLGIKAIHGYEFKKLAKSVCKQHGWREELF